MKTLQNPKIDKRYYLDILEQFRVLFDDYRELALYSGRGAGKSWAVASYLVITAYSKKVRILCTREIQNSIADSVIKLLSDTIHRYKLSPYFAIQRSTIYCKDNGSEFIFKGISNNIDSIKSMENVNICWLEEAQKASKESLDILIPTIFRNKGAQIIYSYNPRAANDAVYQRFHGKALPPKSIVKKVDWRDNPYFLDDMKEARAFDMENDPEMAMHVWEAALCPSPNDIAVIPQAWLRKCVNAHVKLKLELPDYYQHVGLDFADGGMDKSALALREGPVLLDVLEFKENYINGSVTRADLYAKSHKNVTKLFYDANGIGAGAKGDFSRITERTYRAVPFMGSKSAFGKDYDFNGQSTNGEFFRNCKAQAWWHIRFCVQNTLRLLKGVEVNPRKCFFISNDISENTREKLIMELGQASYKHEDGKLMVDKQPDDQPSPNMADGVIMAFAHDIKSGLKAKS